MSRIIIKFFTIVLVTETKEINKNNDEDNKSTNPGKNVKITITDIRGNILNMSYYNNDIKVLKYIGDEEKINMNNAREFADKGIDIFNASDDFFNDKCKYYDINVDITIKDQREDIFQDVNFCGDNYIYNGINYSLNIANCSCNTNSLQDNPKYDEDDEKNEKLNLHNLANSFTSEILKFNFDVIKCANLVLNPKIIKKNAGFYSNIVFTRSQIGALIYFLKQSIAPIKTFLIDYGTKRLSGENSNPPKYFGNNKINNNSQRNINLHKLKLRDNNYNKNKDEKKDGKYKSEIFDVFGSNKNRDMNLYKESEKT